MTFLKKILSSYDERLHGISAVVDLIWSFIALLTSTSLLLLAVYKSGYSFSRDSLELLHGILISSILIQLTSMSIIFLSLVFNSSNRYRRLLTIVSTLIIAPIFISGFCKNPYDVLGAIISTTLITVVYTKDIIDTIFHSMHDNRISD